MLYFIRFSIVFDCSCSCIFSSVDSLMLLVDLINPFLRVHFTLPVLLSSHIGVSCSEIRWAPHLIGVELIWASVLIAVILGVHAIVEGISGFEAQFLVPGVAVEVPQKHQSVVCVFCHFNYLLLFNYY